MISLDYSVGNLEDTFISSKMEQQKKLETSQAFFDILSSCVNAKVILSVPCCQHELNSQIENEVLAPIMKYGLLKERFAALVTDGLRAKRLESEEYETQVLEFIDMEHTPKNILLRAVKKGSLAAKSRKEAEDCERFLKIQPTLGMLLAEQKGDK